MATTSIGVCRDFAGRYFSTGFHGNLEFDGGVLTSQETPIAKFYDLPDGTVLLVRWGRASKETDRHVNTLLRVATSRKIFRVSRVICNTPADHVYNLEFFVTRSTKCLKTASRARIAYNCQWYLSHAENCISELQDYARRFAVGRIAKGKARAILRASDPLAETASQGGLSLPGIQLRLRVLQVAEVLL